jgi:hypothetical protein
MTEIQKPDAKRVDVSIIARKAGWLTALWHGIYPGKLWEFLLFGTLAVLVGWLWYWAFSIPPKIVIEDIVVPKRLQKDGFSGHFLAARIADEIRNIQRVARTTKTPINTSTSETAPDIEVRATVFTLGSIMSFVRETLGNGDRIVTASLYCGAHRLNLLLQGSYSHRGGDDVERRHILDRTITLANTGGCSPPFISSNVQSPEPDCGVYSDSTAENVTLVSLPNCAAQAILTAFDPYFLAAYFFDRAAYYEGIKLMDRTNILGGVDLRKAYGISSVEEADHRRTEEKRKGVEMIKYCLGLAAYSGASDQADERDEQYDKHTRARALYLWGLFLILDDGDRDFARAEMRFAEAARLADSDPELRRRLSFIYYVWGDVHFIEYRHRDERNTEKLYKGAIARSGGDNGYASWGGMLLYQAENRQAAKFSTAEKKLYRSIKNYQGTPNTDIAAMYKLLGDAIWQRSLAQQNVSSGEEGRMKKALRVYQEAINVDASLASAYVQWARILLKERWKNVIDIYNEIMTPEALYCKAVQIYRVHPEEFPDQSLGQLEYDEFKDLENSMQYVVCGNRGEVIWILLFPV